jgi:predicted transcriptional regulator
MQDRKTKIAEAGRALVDTFVATRIAPDIAVRLTRDEMEALAALFVACDALEHADVLIQTWIDQEVEEGEADAGRYGLSPDHELVDNDTYGDEPDDFGYAEWSTPADHAKSAYLASGYPSQQA